MRNTFWTGSPNFVNERTPKSTQSSQLQTAPFAQAARSQRLSRSTQPYPAQLAAANINFVALARLKTLHHELDAEQDPGRPRNLQLVVDGRFTNAKLLKNPPHHTTLIGRIRDGMPNCSSCPRFKAPQGANAFMANRLPHPKNSWLILVSSSKISKPN